MDRQPLENSPTSSKKNETTPAAKSPKRRSKSTVTPPALILPEVPIINKQATLQMLQTRRNSSRGLTRTGQRSIGVQNILQEMVGAPKKSGQAPCGQCECCKSLLSYVTALRNFMDHVVSGMSQGATAPTEKVQAPPCVLCTVQPVEHIEYAQPQEPNDHQHSSEPQPEVNPIVPGNQTLPSPSIQSTPPPIERNLGYSIQSPSSIPPNVPFYQATSHFANKLHINHEEKTAPVTSTNSVPEASNLSVPGVSDSVHVEDQTTNSVPEKSNRSISGVYESLHVEDQNVLTPNQQEQRKEFEKITWNIQTKTKEPERQTEQLDKNGNVAAEEYFDAEEDIQDKEAYVTFAHDNVSSFYCLVLGNSLILSGTTKSLVVLVSDNVGPQMRTLLSTVFHYVQSLDKTSPGVTTLALLEEPELGISFKRLLVWGLEQFTKGIFLEPTTLVVQNCDELFEREELSAAADIGWPDCFNSDVFVYKPSLETFWNLLKLAELEQGFDGGDHGLLNIYFKKWSMDISKKLPFLYNLRANVSYTYKPAFKHFGSQVKIVNFFGSYKPLDVQFHTPTGQMSADANVHPTFAQFVYYWLEIFTKRVVPLLPEEIHDYLKAHKYVCGVDLVKFFPSTIQPGMEQLPTPPSFRVYASGLEKPMKELQLETEEETSSDEAEIGPEQGATGQNPAMGLPGSKLGNYQGMSAWEQGRMDYLGQHKSDTILARLDYFIQGKTQEQ